MKNVLKPPRWRETKHRLQKSWVRPETFRMAILVMQLVAQVAKLIALLKQ
ncbi:hypothetical protein [Thiomonas delicata]|nr:hypothetical protein [Thiomonas delicata]